ncbi:MAG: hypothetical protein M1828_001693 [Chrysothrix sp. TS-e1954]|nr:MAG: hypothetical protein M1828_001693 [Chrysothrix sp. TS-e1954]
MADLVSPPITIALSISPPNFSPGSAVELSITAISHAQTPLTIFTWPTIFHLDLAQRRRNFTCVDLETTEPLQLETTKGGKRPAFSRELGGKDDAHFRTLEPKEPVTFSGPFKLANRMVEGLYALVPGHRYQFGVQNGEGVSWWKEGRKEDVLAPRGEDAGLGEAGGKPIVFEGIEPVDFKVEEPNSVVSQE